MSARVDLEPAFILHARGYRETSQLLEVFTQAHGRVGLVARGARRPKSPLRGLLNPFQPLRLSWSGRGELQTLRDAELAGASLPLSGDALLAGFYLNELLIRFMQRVDPHPHLFAFYSQTINGLQQGTDVEPALRRFEIAMLAEAGYALNFQTDAHQHQPLQPDRRYEFFAEQGAVAVAGDAVNGSYSGAELLAMGRDDFSDAGVRLAARRLLRQVINTHLGEHGLRTRKVAAAMKR